MRRLGYIAMLVTIPYLTQGQKFDQLDLETLFWSGKEFRSKSGVIRYAKKQGYRPMNTYDPPVTDQVERYFHLLQRENPGLGKEAFFLLEKSSHTSISLKQSWQVAYYTALARLMEHAEITEMTVNSKFETVNGITETSGTYQTTFSSKAIMSNIVSVDDNLQKNGYHSELTFSCEGAPLLGVQEVISLYRITDDGQYEVVVGLFLDRKWIEQEGIHIHIND